MAEYGQFWPESQAPKHIIRSVITIQADMSSMLFQIDVGGGVDDIVVEDIGADT